MRVNIKQFNVDMEVKNSGIEFEVRSPDGKKHLGDLILTKSGVEWHKGRASSGPKKSWEELISFIDPK